MGFALNEFNVCGSYSYFVKVSTSHQSETILYKTIIFRLQAVLQSTVFIKNATKKGKANGVLSEGLSEASGEMTTLARAPALLMRRSPEATNKC